MAGRALADPPAEAVGDQGGGAVIGAGQPHYAALELADPRRPLIAAVRAAVG